MTVASVRKTIRISASHHIPNHPGKCRRPHGHNYLVEVWATGPVDDETGMVKDFYEINDDLERVVGLYDHQDLNEMFDNMLTTAENLADYWLAALNSFDDRYTKIRVWETDDSYAEVEY